ncbi:MAG TPA: FAD-dependent oxidoreductase, partial [Longimicrobiaceae bacterium]|nr:FAD-dependent oxidoreductase [Longimicrobiaceae bacterium]
MPASADVVICGAGMAGIAAAYHLAVRQGIRDVLLVDDREPMTLTSDKGTQAYRNWWPGPDDTMVRLMNRSIDLLEELAEESGNHFQLNRRGYAFLTADPDRIPEMQRMAAEICALGAGPLRVHPGSAPYFPSPPESFRDVPNGADLLLDRELIRRHFPFVSEEVVAVLHARRCGWLDALALGRWLLERAQAHGVRLLRDRVGAVSTTGGRVTGVELERGERIDTGAFVIAAGPLLREVGAMLGIELPVFTELHGKIALRDERRIIPLEAPLLIWDDPLHLPWTEEERRELAARTET